MTGAFFDLETGIPLIGHYSYCPFMHTAQMDREVMHSGWSSFLEFIKALVDLDYYIMMWLNQTYIPCSSDYLKKHGENPILIYGYDDQEKIIYTTGFYRDGKFGFETIHYLDILQAEKNLINPNEYIQTILTARYNNNLTFPFDMSEFLLFLNDYLYSKDHTNRFYYIKDKKYFYGLMYYDKLIEQVLMQKKCDIRLLHILVDHKIMMGYRLEYFKSENILASKQFHMLYKTNETLIRETTIIQNFAMKQNYTSTSGFWEDHALLIFKKKVKQLKKADRLFTKKLYDTLKNHL